MSLRFRQLNRRCGKSLLTASLMVAILVLLPGCKRQQHVIATMKLRTGIEALQAGDFESALSSCRESASIEPGNESSLSCWLVASLQIQNWHEAQQSLKRFSELHPEDEQFQAFSIEVGRKLGESSHLKASPELSEPLAWACLDGSCVFGPPDKKQSPPPAPSSLPPERGALYYLLTGQTDSALALLLENGAEEGGQKLDLLLLLLLKTGRYDELNSVMDRLNCTLAQDSQVAVQLALFMGSTDALLKRGCLLSEKKGARSPVLEGEIRARMHTSAADPASGQAEPAAALPQGFEPFLNAVEASRGSRKETMTLLEKAATLAPNQAAFNLNLGIALISRGQFEKALVYLSRAEKGAQDPSLPRLYRCAAHLAKGDLNSARLLKRGMEATTAPGWNDWLSLLLVEAESRLR